MDGAVGTSIVLASHPSMDVVPYPTTIPVAPQLQTAFWTSCAFCGLRLEYAMQYKHCLIRCPHCKNPFIAKEKQLKPVIGQIDSSVPPAPSHASADTSNVDTKNSSVPHSFHNKSTHGISMPGSPLVTENESMQASRKRKGKDLSENFGTEYKVPNNARFEMPPVWSQVSPDVVIAELKKIPDELSPMDWLNALNMLRSNEFQFRSLKALPMDMRKAWLLNQIQ